MRARGWQPERPVQSFTVRDMPLSERPRERLASMGSEALSVPELLALVLGRGVKGESVMMTSQRLMARYGSLDGVLAAPLEELRGIKGIGLAKAAQLKAIHEMRRRLEYELARPAGAAVKGPEDAVKEVGARLRGKKKEHFLTIMLDTRNHVLGISEVSMGSLDASIVEPREVFQPAISASARSVLLVHNHPSGDPHPSEEDIQITRRLVKVGELLGIEVLDHVVVSDHSHLSLKARGLM